MRGLLARLAAFLCQHVSPLVPQVSIARLQPQAVWFIQQPAYGAYAEPH